MTVWWFAGAWPWMMIFGYNVTSKPGQGVHWFCAGTLVTTRHVLTAANCMFNHHDRPVCVHQHCYQTIPTNLYFSKCILVLIWSELGFNKTRIVCFEAEGMNNFSWLLIVYCYQHKCSGGLLMSNVWVYVSVVNNNLLNWNTSQTVWYPFPGTSF